MSGSRGPGRFRALVLFWEPTTRQPHYSPRQQYTSKGDRMVSRRRIIMSAAVLAVLGAWYAFRPERLFVNKTVREAFPAGAQAQAAEPSAPVTLVVGRFHTNAHETKGLATIYRLSDGKRVLRLSEFATSNGPDVHVYLVARRRPGRRDRQAGGLRGPRIDQGQ